MHDSTGLGIIQCAMAEYGEWSRKGATLSHVTARKEYGVDEDFIVAGINAGKLEYREGAGHGNPYIRVLRRQLEAYVGEELGETISVAGKRRPSSGRSRARGLSCANSWTSCRTGGRSSNAEIDRNPDLGSSGTPAIRSPT